MSMIALAPTPTLEAVSRRVRRGFAMHSRLKQTDEALLARVGAGDKQAFAILFGRYAPKVKSYLIRLGAPPAMAEDLAQDAMLSTWRRAKPDQI
jgi:hypothetical protein